MDVVSAWVVSVWLSMGMVWVWCQHGQCGCGCGMMWVQCQHGQCGCGMVWVWHGVGAVSAWAVWVWHGCGVNVLYNMGSVGMARAL